MTGIDIANPGASQDDLENALAALTGQRVLQNVVISDAVTHMDFALPANYQSFRLIMQGVELDSENSLQAVLSPDGGATFYNDSALNGGPETYEAYHNEVFYVTDSTPLCNQLWNNAIDISLSPTLLIQQATVNIYPGAIGEPGDYGGAGGDYASIEGVSLTTGNGARKSYSFRSVLEGEAFGRQDLIRVAPASNLDVGTVRHFIKGTFVLIGIGPT